MQGNRTVMGQTAYRFIHVYIPANDELLQWLGHRNFNTAIKVLRLMVLSHGI